MLSRRKLIQQMVIMGTGIVLVPSCLSDKSKSSILLKNLAINSEEENELAELCETIIPKTATPGAKDLSAHLFVLKMVDDCYPKADQEKFLKGMASFQAFVKSNTGKDFVNCNLLEKKSVIEKSFDLKFDTSEMFAFMKTVKRYTIQAYTGSEFYLTKVQVYQLIPGKYKGCVPA